LINLKLLKTLSPWNPLSFFLFELIVIDSLGFWKNFHLLFYSELSQKNIKPFSAFKVSCATDRPNDSPLEHFVNHMLQMIEFLVAHLLYLSFFVVLQEAVQNSHKRLN
jgi:hypothetical protein